MPRGYTLSARSALGVQGRDRHSLFDGKTLGGSRGFSGGIKRDGLGRTRDFLFHVFLLEPEANTSHHQSPGARKNLQCRSVKDSFGLQISLKYYLKLVGGPRDHPGGNFLAANFK